MAAMGVRRDKAELSDAELAKLSARWGKGSIHACSKPLHLRFMISSGIYRLNLDFNCRVNALGDPAWRIVVDPGLSSLYGHKSIELLFRAFRPSHNNQIATGLRRTNLEGGAVFYCCQFHDFLD